MRALNVYSMDLRLNCAMEYRKAQEAKGKGKRKCKKQKIENQ